jgi:aminoglycoside 2''-phosphotransferase
MIDQHRTYLAEIHKKYPGLVGPETSLVADGGQFNDILIIDGRFIFRFPKYVESLELILREIEILRNICGKLPLAVPDPIYSCVYPQSVGRVFMGYPLISGEPLWREVLSGIQDDAVLARFAAQLAGFLADLHQIQPQEIGLDLAIKDTLDEWIEMYTEIQTHLYPLMRPDARGNVSGHFDKFINNPDLHRFEPALRHGDFGSSNILYDPQSLQISGIIDFGSAGLGDPAVDLAAVSTYGDPFFQKIIEHYPVTGVMLERAAFYRGTFALQEALHGWKNDDQEAFENGMEVYR